MADEKRCDRCGLPNVDLIRGEPEPMGCQAWLGDPESKLACRERELANLRAYHRGIIRRVERIQEQLTDIAEALS